MCSGAYLGEICRLTLVKIFQQQAPTFAWKISSLSTEKVFKIMNDNSEDLISTKEVITEVSDTKKKRRFFLVCVSQVPIIIIQN